MAINAAAPMRVRETHCCLAFIAAVSIASPAGHDSETSIDAIRTIERLRRGGSVPRAIGHCGGASRMPSIPHGKEQLVQRRADGVANVSGLASRGRPDHA